jgi:hypothetical protein
MNPTVILVHGAFAESSSWNDVVRKVTGDGHRVVAFATRCAPSPATRLT